jgi:hypothetical protein
VSIELIHGDKGFYLGKNSPTVSADHLTTKKCYNWSDRSECAARPAL